MRRAALAALLIGSAALSLGCASQVGLGRARTLDPGTNRVGVSLESDFLTPRTWEESNATLPWVQMGVGVHRGITERVELGARAWGFALPTVFSTWGFAADGKVAILRPEPGRGRLNLSAGLSLGYHQPLYGGNAYHVFHGTLPVLLGFSLGRHELVFGPRISDYVITAYGQETVNTFYVGAGLGFAARLRETFDLFPEVILMWSPTSLNGEAEEDEARIGIWMLQGGLGFNWDL